MSSFERGVIRRCGDHPCPPSGCAHGDEDTEEIRRSATGPAPGHVPSAVRAVLSSGGQALPPHVQSQMSRELATNLSHVRVHTDPAAALSASAIAANAYAAGPHIVFGAGQFQPGKPSGDRLLKHELAHVVQQPHLPADLGTLRIGKHDDHAEADANRVAGNSGTNDGRVLAQESEAQRFAGSAPAPARSATPAPTVRRQPATVDVPGTGTPIALVVQHSEGAPDPGAGLSAAGHDEIAQGDGGLSDKDLTAIRGWLAQSGEHAHPSPGFRQADQWSWVTARPTWSQRSSQQIVCNTNCHQTPEEQRQEAARFAEANRQAAMKAAWPGLHQAGHAAELDRESTTLQGDIDAARQAEAQLRLQIFDRVLAANPGSTPTSGSRLTSAMKDSWARAAQAAAVLEAVSRASAGQDAPAVVTDSLRPSFISFYASVSALFRRNDVADQRSLAAAQSALSRGGSACPSGCHQAAPDRPPILTREPQTTFGPLPGLPTAPAAKPVVPDQDLPVGWREKGLMEAVDAVQDARNRTSWSVALGKFRTVTDLLDRILLAEFRAAGGDAGLIESLEYTQHLQSRQERLLLDHPQALKVQAVFYPKDDVSERTDESGRTRYVPRAIPWQFYLVRTPVPTDDRTVPLGFEWQLHDLTAPRREGSPYVSTRHQVTAIEGLARERLDPVPIMRMPIPPKLFRELNNEDFFPEGHLYWRDPVADKPGDLATTAPTSFWTWLGRIGMTVAVLGSLVFAPMSTPFLISVALGTGIKLAANYARLQEKKEHGVWTQADTDQFHWELAQDIVGAVTLGVGRMGVVAAEAGNFARAASAARVWFVLRRVEAVGHLVNIAVLSRDLATQFEAIGAAVKTGKMTQAQADAAYAHFAMMATGLGLLSIVQFRGAVQDLTGRPALMISPHPEVPGRYIASLEVLSASTQRTLRATANVTSKQLARRPADLEREFEAVKASPQRALAGGDYDAEVILSNGHVWRRQVNGRWCRFSDDPLCFIFGEGAGHNVQSFRAYRVARRGEWSGEPGKSDFTPNDPVALRRAGFRPIPYVNDHPVFTEFAEGTVLLRRADLAIKDRHEHNKLADAALARQKGWFLPGTTTPDGPRVAALRADPADPLTWHHVEGDNIMLLVPRSIHHAAQHSGGFAED